MKKTKWFPRKTPPVRHGLYECAVMITSMQKRLINIGLLEWDGVGFLVPYPMAVWYWRGLRNKPSKKKST